MTDQECTQIELEIKEDVSDLLLPERIEEIILKMTHVEEKCVFEDIC